MRIGQGQRTYLWIIAGTLVLLMLTLLVLRFSQNPSEEFAVQARRFELVEQMLRNLTAAAEAEKRAVLAITDEDSQKFADEARAASSLVERERTELEPLLQSEEKGLLNQFSQAFSEYQRI